MKKNIHLVITGHVDHGKSTLIGRLLYDTQSLPKDKIKEIEQISKELGKDAELAFLMDQLKEERERNITIDTAQIPFEYKGQPYTIIDAPGHVEFTRNMLTGAAQADLAVLMIDAREGIEEQTIRHLYLLDFIGLTRVIPVVNKLDLIDYDEKRFLEIGRQLKEKTSSLKVELADAVPISAAMGEGILKTSAHMKWYRGKPLLKCLYLEESHAQNSEFEMGIQDHYLIDEQHIDVGLVAGGEVKKGMQLWVLPDEQQVEVLKILKYEGEQKNALAGENIGLVCSEKLQRGKVLVADPNARAFTELKTNIFWLAEQQIGLHDTIDIRLDTQQSTAEIISISDKINTAELQPVENNQVLAQNEAAAVVLQLKEPLYAQSFSKSKSFGRFVLEKEMAIEAVGIIQ